MFGDESQLIPVLVGVLQVRRYFHAHKQHVWSLRFGCLIFFPATITACFVIPVWLVAFPRLRKEHALGCGFVYVSGVVSIISRSTISLSHISYLSMSLKGTFQIGNLAYQFQGTYMFYGEGYILAFFLFFSDIQIYHWHFFVTSCYDITCMSLLAWDSSSCLQTVS